MIKGIYTSASGMLPRILKQETLANNMANVNTTGYKKSKVEFQYVHYTKPRTPGAGATTGANGHKGSFRLSADGLIVTSDKVSQIAGGLKR